MSVFLVTVDRVIIRMVAIEQFGSAITLLASSVQIADGKVLSTDKS